MFTFRKPTETMSGAELHDQGAVKTLGYLFDFAIYTYLPTFYCIISSQLK